MSTITPCLDVKNGDVVEGSVIDSGVLVTAMTVKWNQVSEKNQSINHLIDCDKQQHWDSDQPTTQHSTDRDRRERITRTTSRLVGCVEVCVERCL